MWFYKLNISNIGYVNLYYWVFTVNELNTLLFLNDKELSFLADVDMILNSGNLDETGLTSISSSLDSELDELFVLME